jgi:signal transduction histidine kinase
MPIPGERHRATDPAAALAWFAAVTLAVSAIVLLGWLADIQILIRPIPTLRGIPFNAALGLTLLAAGQLALASERRVLARACAAASLALGAATLLQHVLGVALGLDELFVRARYGPPRMSINASAGITVLAAALLLAARSKGRTLALPRALLASGGWAVALTGAVGYLGGVPTAYGWGQFAPMAVQVPPLMACATILALARAWQDSVTTEVPVPTWLTFAVGAGSLAATLVIWQALEAAEHTAGHLDSALPVMTLAFGVAASATTTAAVEYWRRAHLLALALDHQNRVLAERDQYQDAVLETLPVGVFFANETGLIYRANRAGRDIWAGMRLVAPDEYHVYKAWWAHSGERIKNEDWALARAVFHGERSSGEIVDIECFDGSRKTIINTALPVHDAEGRRIGGVAVIQDITQRRAIERTLEDRTNDLERSNKDLAEFAYVASHDLQEPLRMVASYVQLLARRYKDSLDDDAREFINYAVDGAQRMQQLLSDLLAYSRAGSPQGPVDCVDLNACATAAIQNLAAAVQESGATIRVAPLPSVQGRATQLTQVLQNIIGNALKFTGDRPPIVRVTATCDGGQATVRVTDNGIGLDPAQAERIFLIFQRLNERGKYPGTGLGLAICKKIVGRHGGRIWVESQPGQGASFCFTLPVISLASTTRGAVA